MKFQGLPISPGVALGPAYLYRSAELQVPRDTISPECTAAELERYAAAKASAEAQLADIHDSLARSAPGQAAIFRAHLEILRDAAIAEEIEALIRLDHFNAAHAADTVYAQYTERMLSLEDAAMRERAADLTDVRTRLLCCLLQIRRTSLAEIARPSIVVAHELLPSDTALLNAGMVRAVITETGGAASHSAILAKSLGIPSVSGLPGILDRLQDGQLLAVCAAQGTVESDPDPETLQRCRALERQYRQEQDRTQAFLHAQPVMPSGEYVQVALNIGSDTDPALDYAAASDGVGLFRSEFLYMQSPTLPDEASQYRAYTHVAKRLDGKQVTIRTLDVGGDKQIHALPMEPEANPFLGYRALRLCFDREDLFQTQLRAILRAALHGRLAILFPMVGSLEDLRRAKDAVRHAAHTLASDGIPFCQDVPVGIMIEIPSIALMADQVAQEVDFASLGTNDLCQYLLAADRMNPRVASYYQPYHPALFRLIGHVQQAFSRAGKPLGVCGELGADPPAALALLSLGIRKFSMSPAAIASVKQVIRHADPQCLLQASELLKSCRTAAEAASGLTELVNRIQSPERSAPCTPKL